MSATALFRRIRGDVLGCVFASRVLDCDGLLACARTLSMLRELAVTVSQTTQNLKPTRFLECIAPKPTAIPGVFLLSCVRALELCALCL